MPSRIPNRRWHAGELLAQQQRGFEDAAFGVFEGYAAGLGATDPPFFPSLNILPLTSLDNERRPWVSVLTGNEGQRGFCRFGRGGQGEDILRIKTSSYEGLPLKEALETVKSNQIQEEVLVGSVGVEFENRRRNKFEGQIIRHGFDEDGEMEFDVEVFHSFGNCPKYINTRRFVPSKSGKTPQLVSSDLHMPQGTSLPKNVLDLIESSDLVYLGTRHTASEEEYWDGTKDVDRVACNHRGGSPGFVRTFFDESKGRTCLVLPDYSGNRLMMSFGNVAGEKDQVAGLAISSFGFSADEGTSTSVLHLTGDAKVIVGEEVENYFRGINSCLLVWITGFSLVDHIPLVISGGEEEEDAKKVILKAEEKKKLVGWSPYNPRIKNLIQEKLGDGSREAILASSPKASATLVRVEFLGTELGVFTFRTPLQLPDGEKLKSEAGQHIILDGSSSLDFRVTSYRHMAKGQEKELNDDGVRSWTISSSRSIGDEFEFQLTLRRVPGGAVTPNLFWQGQRLQELQSKNLQDAPFETYTLPEDPLVLPLLGITGDMLLPSNPTKLLYLTSGIGITPLLAHLRQLSSRAVQDQQPLDVIAILACREGEARNLQSLIQAAVLSQGNAPSGVKVHILTRSDEEAFPVSNFEVNIHKDKRLGIDSFSSDSKPVHPTFSLPIPIQDREIYLCGTPAFEKVAREALENVGIRKFNHESFAF